MISRDKFTVTIIVSLEVIVSLFIYTGGDGGLESSLHMLTGVLLFIGLEVLRLWRSTLKTKLILMNKALDDANDQGFNEGYREAVKAKSQLWEPVNETSEKMD
ncbi:hypothetical protein [Rahnella contaminans]|uniref:hypothetical protein n=1 Tax=Rahnella contaminans TaxID=2703882 RepID=UPI003C2BA4A0